MKYIHKIICRNPKIHVLHVLPYGGSPKQYGSWFIMVYHLINQLDIYIYLLYNIYIYIYIYIYIHRYHHPNDYYWSEQNQHSPT